jgi:hypothetical protein
LDKIQIIEKLFFSIVTYSYLILPLIFLLFVKKKRDAIIISIYGILFFLLLFISESIPRNSESVEIQKLFSSSYTLLEYLFFTAFLWTSIQNKKFRKIILILSGGFVVFQIIFYFNFQIDQRNVLDTVPIGIETILLFIFIFFFFYQFIKYTLNEYVYNHPCFWIAVGILIYLGGSFFFNILANDVSSEQIDKYWFLTYIAEIIKNILFTVALVMYLRRPREITKKETVPNLDFSFNE